MLIFPAWTVFDFDVKMVGTSAAQMAGNLLTQGAAWIGQMFGKSGRWENMPTLFRFPLLYFWFLFSTR
jgi:hypothetical protein